MPGKATTAPHLNRFARREGVYPRVVGLVVAKTNRISPNQGILVV